MSAIFRSAGQGVNPCNWSGRWTSALVPITDSSGTFLKVHFVHNRSRHLASYWFASFVLDNFVAEIYANRRARVTRRARV
jgi:hypothetical protein